MNPDQLTQTPAPAPQQPIQDVVPPHGSLDNPPPPSTQNPVLNEAPTSDTTPNPIAGTAAAQSTVIHEQPHADQHLDGVLQNVTNNLKTTPPDQQKEKKKFRLFGSNKKKPTVAIHSNQSPLPNPIQQALPKPKKPILPISIAILAAIGLVAAAFFAY